MPEKIKRNGEITMSINEEHIERYFNNLLSEAEKLKFENKLASDNDFKKVVEAYAVIYNSLDEIKAEELLNRLRKVESSIEGEIEQQQGIPLYFRWAAVFIFLVSVSLWFYLGIAPSEKALFLAYYEPYPNVEDPVSRSGENTAEVWKLYEAQDYTAAYVLFQSNLEINPNDNASRFYAGICALELNTLDSAEGAFSTIVSNKDPRFFEQAQWYLALTYLKAGDETALDQVLEDIIESASSYNKKADELRTALD